MQKEKSLKVLKSLKDFNPSISAIIFCAIIVSLGLIYYAYSSPGTTTIGQNISTDGNLAVSGNATTTGTHHIGGNFSLSGIANFLSNLVVGGNATTTGNLVVSGTATLATTSIAGPLGMNSYAINNAKEIMEIRNAAEFSSIQAAVNDLPSDGGVVYIPPGTYTFSDTLNLTGKRVVLEGAGVDLTILSYTGTGTGIVADTTRTQIKNIRLNGNNTGNLGIHFNPSTWQIDFLVRDVLVYKFYNGIFLNYGGRHRIENTRVYGMGSSQDNTYGVRLGEGSPANKSNTAPLLDHVYAGDFEMGLWSNYAVHVLTIDFTVEDCEYGIFQQTAGGVHIRPYTESLNGAAERFYFSNPSTVSTIIDDTGSDTLYNVASGTYTGYSKKAYTNSIHIQAGGNITATGILKPSGVQESLYREQTFANLVKNSGFEYYLNGWTTGGTGTDSDETTTKKEGGHSRKVVTSAGQTLQIYQDFHTRAGGTSFIGDDDDTLSIGAWVKSNSSSTAIKIERHAYPYDVCSDTHSGGGDWEYLHCTAVAEGTLSYLRAVLYTGENDTAYFDDVVATRGLPIAPSRYMLPDILEVSGSATLAEAGGNVGIGTTTPSNLLHIYSTATTTANFDSSSASRGACLKLKDSDGSGYSYCTINNGVLTCSTASCE